MKVLELFSGIGGMHLALSASNVAGEILAAVDINTVANEVYKHNFPKTPLLNCNIEGLSASAINKIGADTILMSPPCQPFTRNGLKADVKDNRTGPFKLLVNLLPELKIENILIENVKGFEVSEMRNILIDTLTSSGFLYQEFIVCPTYFDVPNKRERYYCIAKKLPNKFNFQNGTLMHNLPGYTSNQLERVLVYDCIDCNTDITPFLLSEKILMKRAKILDICFEDSEKTCCFTKGYGRYVEGTGSVFTNKTKENMHGVYRELEETKLGSDEYLTLIKTLNLRFFMPSEICKLMSFPGTFTFPNHITNRQRYMLLGNSINVKVVSHLINLLGN